MPPSDSTAVPVLENQAMKTLRSRLEGKLLEPGDADFGSVCRLWNGAIERRPALIARCASAQDVVKAVDFAREWDLTLAVRAGGHHPSGYALCDGGLVIDVTPMKGVHVDPLGQAVQAQAGLTWVEFDRATADFGLATPGGNVSDTGIAGLTVGGGIGWISRKYGLTCDNLISAEVVTADGQLVKASPTENADLFWGIRGGSGNFGVVTTFEYRLHPLQHILGGRVVYPLDQVRDVLRFVRGVLATAPDELGLGMFFLTAATQPLQQQGSEQEVLLALSVSYAGGSEEGEKVVRPLRTIASPLVDLIRTQAYTELQASSDALATHGFPCYEKSIYLAELSDKVIDVLMERAACMTSSFSHLHVVLLGGAVSRVGEDDTAFSHRNAAFECYILPRWTHGDEADRHIEWALQTYSALRPFSTGGGYLNRHIEEDPSRLCEEYGPAKYERLAALKHKFDPTNFFHMNHNIPPRAG